MAELFIYDERVTKCFIFILNFSDRTLKFSVQIQYKNPIKLLLGVRERLTKRVTAPPIIILKT